MSNCPLCNLDPVPKPTVTNDGNGKRPTGLLRRAWMGVQWLSPSMLMIFIPKCPLCVAAYVTLFTGLTISVTTAHWIQILTFALCLFALAFLIVRHTPLFRRRTHAHRTSHAR